MWSTNTQVPPGGKHLKVNAGCSDGADLKAFFKWDGDNNVAGTRFSAPIDLCTAAAAAQRRKTLSRDNEIVPRGERKKKKKKEAASDITY